jgi:hypothetical protein
VARARPTALRSTPTIDSGTSRVVVDEGSLAFAKLGDPIAAPYFAF